MGAYTDVISITAPSEAVAGERVNITVRIKNLYSATIGIMVGGALEYGVSPWPGITFSDASDNVAAGSTKSFSGYFTMPDEDVNIHAYAYYYGTDGMWHYDDELTEEVEVVSYPNSDFSSLDVSAEAGVYDIGDKVPYDFTFRYQGPPQWSYFTLQLLKGFSVKYTYPAMPLYLAGAMDWATKSGSGTVTLPDGLEAGESYKLKITVEAADGEDESDTTGSVIEIAGVPESEFGSIEITNYARR